MFSYKNMFFSIVDNYLRPLENSRQVIFNINAVVLIVKICLSIWFMRYSGILLWLFFNTCHLGLK